jgi:tetrahydromethanopterin S-methyltransferase subunit C
MSQTLGTGGYFASFIGASIIAVVVMLGAIAIQHPFNATLGPSWAQDRMLYLAAECGFLSMVVISLMSAPFVSTPALVISFIVSVAGWFYTYMMYIRMSQRDAAMWLDAKPIVEPEA